MANYIVRDENGRAYELGSSLGDGGQGIAWRVKGDDRYVIKTLKPSFVGIDSKDKTDLILRDDTVYEKYAKKVRRLKAMCELAELKNVATPIAVLDRPCCGYVMKLMDGMEPLALQMYGDNEHMIPVVGKNSSLAKKLIVLKKVAEIMRQLHSHGLVYCDFSPNNIFVSKRAEHSEVWLIDSDNLVYENKSKLVIGTPGYRAPEICLIKSPNTFKSDLYSFALIAFEYLTGGKPFDDDGDTGWDSDDGFSDLDAAEKGEVDYLYEFTNDPKDRIPLDYVCTDAMKRLFLRTFNKTGRSDPRMRPSAGEWVAALDEAYNTVCECNGAVAHSFLASECAWCKASKQKHPDLGIYRMTVTGMPAIDEMRGGAWDETPPPKLSGYFSKQKYFAVPVKAKKTFSVDIRALLAPADSGIFEKITFSKDGSVKLENCIFKTKYDGGPLKIMQPVHWQLKLNGLIMPLQMTIERIK